MTEISRSRFLFLGTALLLAACAKENATMGTRRMDPIEPARSDSSGVTMLVHDAQAFDQAPRVEIDSVAIVTMHGSADDPDQDISTIDPVLFLADGRLIGIDHQRQAVMVFGADGGTRVAFGRQGSGPGEFAFITDLIRAGGDSLLIFDPRNGRVTAFSPDTGMGAEYSLSEAMGAGGSSPVALAGHELLTWGFSFAAGSEAPPGVKGVMLDLAHNTARLVFNTGPSKEDESKPQEIKGSNGSVMAIRAVSIKPLTGFPSAFGWQGQYVLADGNDYRFEVRDTTGKMMLVLRVDRPRVPVTEAMWQKYVDAQIAGFSAAMGSGATVVVGGGGGGGGPDTAAVRQRMAAAAHSDSLPAIRDSWVTPGGTLWVLDYPVPGDSGWAATAFAPDGRILGRVVEPTGSAPVAWGDDRLAFRSEDELGIATITIRRIHFFK